MVEAVGNIYFDVSDDDFTLSQLATTASQVSRAIIARAGISTSIVSDLQNRRVPALNFQPLRIK